MKTKRQWFRERNKLIAYSAAIILGLASGLAIGYYLLKPKPYAYHQTIHDIWTATTTQNYWR
jgi:hypothetical protein